MNSLKEYLGYWAVKIFGRIICSLPQSTGLWLGRRVGSLGYYLDSKHRSLAYANLKIAFGKTKSPQEIKRIVKRLFQNYGQNLIELFRLPFMDSQGIENFVKVDGQEHVHEGLKKGKGVILLAMHFGSWELSSFMSKMLNHPYKVIVKPQNRYTKLDEVLNSYRQVAGSTVIAKGAGTRELIESLRHNEVVGMVVDQGGKDGELVKFFGRSASMSVGAIRMGLKFDVPVCFSVIVREKGARHRLIIHPPVELVKTGDTDKDVITNLGQIIRMMEIFIEQYPAEYMWFYKIWKYSRESVTAILNDGKLGHLRQSQTVAKMVDTALSQRDITSETKLIDIHFKSKAAARLAGLISFLTPSYFCQGRIQYLKWFVTPESFSEIVYTKTDYVISCGATVAGINFLLSRENRAKSICVLKPGILGMKRFHLVILPRHDRPHAIVNGCILVTQGAPNLITKDYLETQSSLLGQRYPALQKRGKFRVGVLLGGDAKDEFLSHAQIRTLIGQVKGACGQLNAEILLTTSRRTSLAVENIIYKEFKGHPLCSLLIIANRKNIPEAVGGILGLADAVVVSGDSISMVSEAASSGKNTIVFRVQKKDGFAFKGDRHEIFLKNLATGGYIHLSDERHIGQTIIDMAKNKIKTRTLNDHEVILEGVKRII